MKAVIVEKRGDYAAVLCDDGSITRIKSKNCNIGQVIEMKKGKMSKKFISIAAAAAVFVMLMGTSLWAYYSPYSYVSVDVNPSIEYSINRFDKIIGVKGMNEDGEAVIAKLDLINKDIDEGVKETVKQIADMGYFSETGDNTIVVTTNSGSDEKADELTEELKDNAEVAADENNVEAVVDSTKIGYERVQEARKLGVTPGKLNLVQRLAESSEEPDSIVVEEWLNKPVKEIMKEIKENKGKSQSSNNSKNNGKDQPAATATASASGQIDPSATSQPTNTTEPNLAATPAPTEKKNSNNGNGNGNNNGNNGNNNGNNGNGNSKKD